MLHSWSRASFRRSGNLPLTYHDGYDRVVRDVIIVMIVFIDRVLQMMMPFHGRASISGRWGIVVVHRDECIECWSLSPSKI